MSAVGNLNDYVKFQMAQGMGQGGNSPGAAATEMAIGLAMAQQIIHQQGGLASPAGHTPPPPIPAPGAQAGAQSSFDLLSPAEAAKLLGVTEDDVLASLAAGDLKAKKIGATYRIARSAWTNFCARDTGSCCNFVEQEG
jgi:excisionase family DNA binding protein